MTITQLQGNWKMHGTKKKTAKTSCPASSREKLRGEGARGLTKVVLPLEEEAVACLQTSDAVFHQKHPVASPAHELARISPIKSSICTIDRRSAAAAPGENKPRSEKPIAVSRSMETCTGSSCVAAKINTAKRRKKWRTDSLFFPAH